MKDILLTEKEMVFLVLLYFYDLGIHWKYLSSGILKNKHFLVSQDAELTNDVWWIKECLKTQFFT